MRRTPRSSACRSWRQAKPARRERTRARWRRTGTRALSNRSHLSRSCWTGGGSDERGRTSSSDRRTRTTRDRPWTTATASRWTACPALGRASASRPPRRGCSEGSLGSFERAPVGEGRRSVARDLLRAPARRGRPDRLPSLFPQPSVRRRSRRKHSRDARPRPPAPADAPGSTPTWHAPLGRVYWSLIASKRRELAARGRLIRSWCSRAGTTRSMCLCTWTLRTRRACPPAGRSTPRSRCLCSLPPAANQLPRMARAPPRMRRHTFGLLKPISSQFSL